MSLSYWIILFICIQIIHFAGTWKLYIKAGRKPWEAIIPIYNAYILMKIIQRPTWRVFLLFIPIVNLIIFPSIWVELLRCFGKTSKKDACLVVFTLGGYLYLINYNKETKYVENRDLTPPYENLYFTIYAVVCATIIHTYIFQPTIIPSSSLEKTLLIGDFLVVSKFHYGARIPSTTLALPMMHDTLPIIGLKSYLFNDKYSEKNNSWSNKFQLPYLRLPGFKNIERTEIVVFNSPADTTYNINVYHPDRYYNKPLDKKLSLVKRCVGLPGDSLSMKNGYVHINGKQLILPKSAKPQFSHIITTNGADLNLPYIKSELNINDPIQRIAQNQYYFKSLTITGANRIKNMPNVIGVKKIINKPEKNIFPKSNLNNWSSDNLGPIYIPKKGVTIQLDKSNIYQYKRLISEYEHNTLEIKGNNILINGIIATSYTFKQNYYWMMGDNRHNSLDSRVYGYVPEDHIVGKPVFIWMSIDQYAKGLFNKIRWERVFTLVGDEENPTSYFKYFLALLALGFGFDYFRKKKQKAAQE